MKRSNFIIFFGILFTAYRLINYYIFIRGWQSLQGDSSLRPFYVLIFIIPVLSFIGGRILMDHQPFQLGEAAANRIDLQLSGNIHHGQLWPFNFVARWYTR